MAAFVVMAALAASADLPSVASIDGSLDCGQRRLSWRRDLQRRLPITESYDSLPSAPSLSSFLQLQSAGRRVESLEANYFTPDSKPSRRVQKSAMVIHNIRFRANRKPPAVAAELKSVFTVIKLTTAKPEGGDEVGAGAPMVSVRGVHPTEEQAYAAAMLDLLYSLEVAEGDPLPKVRAIAKTKTLPAKDQLKSIQSSCQDSEAAERFEFLVGSHLRFFSSLRHLRLSCALDPFYLYCGCVSNLLQWKAKTRRNQKPHIGFLGIFFILP